MPLSPKIRRTALAGALATALAVAGFAQGATTHARHKRHRGSATVRSSAHSSAGRTASVHRASRHSRHYRRSAHRRHVIHGQRAMDSERASEIQQALIQAHYLSGSPSGQWDAATQAAMVKYQTDNGWQTKIAPDSRALIKLGLGPKQDAGEYAAPAGLSKSSVSVGNDPIRTLAASEMPSTTTQN